MAVLVVLILFAKVFSDPPPLVRAHGFSRDECDCQSFKNVPATVDDQQISLNFKSPFTVFNRPAVMCWQESSQSKLCELDFIKFLGGTLLTQGAAFQLK